MPSTLNEHPHKISWAVVFVIFSILTILALTAFLTQKAFAPQDSTTYFRAPENTEARYNSNRPRSSATPLVVTDDLLDKINTNFNREEKLNNNPNLREE